MRTLPLLVALLASCANLSSSAELGDADEANAQLARLIALQGNWYAADGSEAGPVLTYELTSGGSAVLETEFPGQDHEMRTMYYVQGGNLSLVHYCSLGNQPRMVAQSWDANTLHFALDGDGGLDSMKEMYMHSVKFNFHSADSMTQAWTVYQDGKPGDTHEFELVRR